MIQPNDNNYENFSVLVKQKVKIEILFDHPSFMDEITYQNEDLFLYLSEKENIEKMMNYVYSPQLNGLTQKKVATYAFYSFKVISDCHPKLTENIVTNKIFMKKLFSLIGDNTDQNITSRGYFQSIMKNFLCDLNPVLYTFVKELKNQAERCIFPLVKNLNKANAEIIKDILSSNNEKLKKLQLCIFEFLLFYYLNEQFKKVDLHEKFQNLIEIFKFLKTIDEVYNYKLKYEHTLYSEEFVKNNECREYIYSFKLVLLNYIAFTGQIKTCKKPLKFLLSYKKYQKSPNFFFYLKDILTFFQTISKNKEFEQDLNIDFFKALLEIMLSNPTKDIHHYVIVRIFENLKNYINSNKSLMEKICEFILYETPKIKFPNEIKKQINPISLNFIYQIILLLDLTQLANSPHKDDIMHQKDLLQTVFTKLCFDENEADISETVETSEIIPVKDFNFFKKGSRYIPENDKRFHYEDDILEPEPLDTPEKNSDVYKIVTDFVDSDESEDEQNNYKNIILSQTDNNINDNLSYHLEPIQTKEQERLTTKMNAQNLLLSDSYNQFQFLIIFLIHKNVVQKQQKQ